jgi:hypothetical protein
MRNAFAGGAFFRQTALADQFSKLRLGSVTKTSHAALLDD